MATWKITITGKGLRKASVEKLIKQMESQFDGASVSVVDATPPESRADRFAAAQNLVSDAKCDMESLHDELQDWYDNLPENFQSGEKGEQLTSAIEELENTISQLEEAETASVEFPSMMG